MPAQSTRFDMGVEAQIRGNKAVHRRLSEMADRGADMRPVMRRIRDLIIEGHEANFESEGGEFGRKWKPNAPGTLARKARLNQGSDPMVATGAVRTAIGGGSGKTARVSKSKVSVGVSKKLSYVLPNMKGSYSPHTGSRRPKRAVVGMSRRNRSKALSMCRSYVLEGRI